MSYQEIPPYPDPEMQAALRSLEFDPLPPAWEQAYPDDNTHNDSTNWRYSA